MSHPLSNVFGWMTSEAAPAEEEPVQSEPKPMHPPKPKTRTRKKPAGEAPVPKDPKT